MGVGDVVDADYRCFCAPGNWLSEHSILAANPLRRRETLTQVKGPADWSHGGAFPVKLQRFA